MELISHPDRSLQAHLAACNTVSKKQLAMKYIVANAFFDADLLEQMRHLLVYFHDFGKGTDYFQLKIIEATESKIDNICFKEKMQAYLDFFNREKRAVAKKEWTENDRLSNHAKLGSYFVQSCFKNDDPILPFILLKVIRRHHGNLTNFFTDSRENPQIKLEKREIEALGKQVEKMNFELYQSILSNQSLTIDAAYWEKIKKRFSRETVTDEAFMFLQKQRDPRYFFAQHFLFSLLLSADKGDMMFELEKENRFDDIKANRLLPLSIITDFKNWKYQDETPRPIDQVREEAYQDIAAVCQTHHDKAFFSITLPTGLGKTYAAYNVAVILQNAFAKQTNVVPRIVYVLPFTSIIDQNEAILREILDNTEGVNGSWLSKNHYLSTYNDHYDETELKNDESEYLADGWEHDVIVTTFVQMLESIFTDRNRTLRKFHNMTNAIFILDEVQNIPPHYHEVIELIFKKMNEYFGTRFVFVTATQPFLFAEASDVQELADPKKYFSGLSRITLDQSLLKENDYNKLEINDFWQILKTDIESQIEKSFLVICNTIKQSQEIYDLVINEFGEKNEVLYLSSSILPIMRKWVIRQIKRKSKLRKIVISTQVVEAGVDIDLDIVYRDFAPMDSINQSAGRCKRNSLKDGGGIVKLFNLDKARYIYDDTILDKTRSILRGYPILIPESDLYDLNIAYAKAIRKAVADDSDKSKFLIDAIHELRTEDIAKNFELIKADYRHINVFLLCCNGARRIWKKYQLACKTEGDFERKRAIKKIKPRLLQYVTRFPKNKFVTKSEASIVPVENWQEYYDLKTGFKNVEEKTFIV